MKLLFGPLRFAIAAGVAFTAASQVHADIGYQLVTVGNSGNAPDPGTGYGEVDYTYDIGKYDVTLNQYCTFLNVVANSDPYGLYSAALEQQPNSEGISRSGSSGSYSYSVIGDGNRPVTIVTWYDAARFANWMQNGQPTGLGEVAGSTEQGAYTLNGATSGIITKNGSATVWIPTENEWYKAAYYDPNQGGPGAGGYWTYATKSNNAPGNVVGNGANQANYNTGVYSVTQSSTLNASQNYLTDVGAFSSSASAYGTYDQNGNVYQWNDAVIGASRGIRGGSWVTSVSNLQSSYRGVVNPTSFGTDTGFRLAAVPEPAVTGMILAGGGLLLARRKRS